MLFRRKPEKSFAYAPDYSSPLSQLFNLERKVRDISSHYAPLHNNNEALAWRLALIEHASQSIDAQYYSWRTDISGKLLISTLIDAADRGVRVRLLLDDIHTFGADRQIATLNLHRNIEVKIFNPFKLRWPYRSIRFLEFIFNISRLNHRMHNKLFIVDNLAAIIGGRNISDEYFGLGNQRIFRDLDILICGCTVEKFSESFDHFWNSSITKTARRIIAFRPRRLDYRHLKKWLNKNNRINNLSIEAIVKIKSTLIANSDSALSFSSDSAVVIYDDPDISDSQRNVAEKIYHCNTRTLNSLVIISAYFVPTAYILSTIKNLIDNGIRVEIYTNSLESIDVTAAFSGYQKHRDQLLTMGVVLFEYRVKSDANSKKTFPENHIMPSCLHAKSIIYDNDSVYIGTFNLDPRSSAINTEIGVIIDDTVLAKNIHSAFDAEISTGDFWRVQYNQYGSICWTCETETIMKQPARHCWQRLINTLFLKLPLHEQL